MIGQWERYDITGTLKQSVYFSIHKLSFPKSVVIVLHQIVYIYIRFSCIRDKQPNFSQATRHSFETISYQLSRVQ